MTGGRTYQTFWRRVLATYVDVLVFSPLVALEAWLPFRGDPSAWLPVAVPLTSAAFAAYRIYLHGRFGQTVGKRLLRLKVVDLSGLPLTRLQAWRREALALPFVVWGLVGVVLFMLQRANPYDADSPLNSWLVGGVASSLSGLGLASTLYSKKRRALHDLIAGSVVIRVERSRARSRGEHAGDVPSAAVPS